MREAELAVSQFKTGLNCSQAILSAYAKRFSLDQATALKLASGFGGGMGRTAETCGAVTGAMMVLGLAYGNVVADPQAKEAMYARARQFAENFKARHGSLLCRDLLGCDISTPEGLDKAKKTGVFATVCVDLVHNSAELLDEMLSHPEA